MAFFGATGGGMKGEYKETFFYDGRRFVMDARWVWMRQKQVIFRNGTPDDIFNEIGLLPGRKGLLWGADAYSLEFAEAALRRGAFLTVVASRSKEGKGIEALNQMGVPSSRIIDRDLLEFQDDMPDPLNEDGLPNPEYASGYMASARALGRAIWGVLGNRVSPDFIVERPDQSTLHFSSFVLKDYSEQDDMACGYIVAKGSSNLSIKGSHMYRATQAREVINLLAQGKIVMAQDDLNITDLKGLPEIQQKMLDGKMRKPKGVAFVQADQEGRPVAYYEQNYLGEPLRQSRPEADEYLDINNAEGICIVTINRPDALNALNGGLVSQLGEVVREIKEKATLSGKPVQALILRGSGRAFVAGADVTEFAGNTASNVREIAGKNIQMCTDLENLATPVIALVDGFALGGGNELSMSTHYRIVTENAQLGQPEIKLGIIPGYGGMQRLPRLIGPRKAAEMSVNGEPVDGRTAVSMGLADEFVPSSTALLRAVRIAQQLISGERHIQRRDWAAITKDQMDDLDDLLKDGKVAALMASPQPEGETAKDLQAARRYTARVVFESMVFGYRSGFEKGLENDARLFGELAASPSGREWIGRFIAKDPEQSSFLTLLD
jgi:enoyl-CoA hydratase